jgi:hypothetical protein
MLQAGNVSTSHATILDTRPDTGTVGTVQSMATKLCGVCGQSASPLGREVPCDLVRKILLVQKSLHRSVYTLYSIQISVRAPPADTQISPAAPTSRFGCLRSWLGDINCRIACYCTPEAS